MDEDIRKSEFNRKKIEQLKEKIGFTDARKLIDYILNIKKYATEEDKKKLMEDITKKEEEIGQYLVLLAIETGDLTESEWLDLKNNYGLDFFHMATILSTYFGKQDLGEEVKIVTFPSTKIYKNKEIIYNKFGIEVADINDYLSMYQQMVDDDTNG